MVDLNTLPSRIEGGLRLDKGQAMSLWQAELNALMDCAHRVKRLFFGDRYDLCAVKSIKGGHCSEDCRYCSQSAHYNGGAPVFPLVGCDEVVLEARSLAPTGVSRLCLVSSGKRMTDREVDRVCSYVRRVTALRQTDPDMDPHGGDRSRDNGPGIPVKTHAGPGNGYGGYIGQCTASVKDGQFNADTGINEKNCSLTEGDKYIGGYAGAKYGRYIGQSNDRGKLSGLNDDCRTAQSDSFTPPLTCCTSIGLSTCSQLARLKAAGVRRIHNNLETSRRFFPQVCSTHTYDEKIEVIRNARSLGLEVCSGGLFGLGEDNEDRVDLALTLRELGADSIPINVLNPIPGTPLGDRPVLKQEELLRIIAIYRLLLPDREIRLCGRSVLCDGGRAAFSAGLSSAITGNLLTVSGISVQDDLDMIAGCGGHL